MKAAIERALNLRIDWPATLTVLIAGPALIGWALALLVVNLAA